MPASNPFEFAPDPSIPGMVPENFPPEVRVLAPADPIASAPGETTYRLSKRIVLPPGRILVRSQADDSASWWLGVDGISSRLLHTHVGFSNVSDWEFWSDGGTFRIDIVLQNIPAAPNPCWVAYAMRHEGRLIDWSEADDWLLDTVPIPDEDLDAVNDPRRSLPVWTIPPNWQGGVTERLSWLTDVMQSESGAEQRRAVRVHPRRSIEAGFLRKGRLRNRIDAFLAGVGRGPLLVPLWFEAVRMLEGITPGASGVSFSGPTVPQREFRTGDLVLVTQGDPADYDILEVGNTSQSRFDWAESPARGWPRGTKIYPLREARIMDPPQVQQPTDTVAITQVRFELSRPDPRVPSWGGSNGELAIFNFKPNRAQAINYTYDRKTFVVDNQVGRLQVTDLGDAQVGTRMDFLLRGRTMTFEFRQMLAAAMGRTNSFICPTFLHDIDPVGDIPAGNFIETLPAGFTDYLDPLQPIRRTIVIFFRNGNPPEYRQITGSEKIFESGKHARDRIYLDEPLNEIPRSMILRISYATPTRLDQDSIELQHLVGNLAAVRTTLVMRQLYDRRTTTPIG